MAQKTGYLSGNLKLFHLVDKRRWICPYHYHDFDKITLLFQGHVSYDVEGTAYDLKPYDIVVIPAGKIHRPTIMDDAPYERIIAYISPAYLKTYRQRGCPVEQIFSASRSPILRQPRKRTACITYPAASGVPGRIRDRKGRSFRKPCFPSFSSTCGWM